jgi:hypothetical protein
MTASPHRPTFRHVPYSDERLQDLVMALRETHMNGGAKLACFEVQYDGPTPWHWTTTSDGAPDVDLSAFFASSELALALPELHTSEGLLRDPAWAWTGPFILDGQLTEILVNGGAHYRFKGPPKDAKRLAEGFCDAIFGERYHDVNRTLYSGEAWSPWFSGVAWDSSWVIVDDGTQRIWLLCVTDTD